MNWSELKQIIRHIRNNKLSSFINIFGLGIGLGCVILMGTYVLHEFSFDKYHKNSENLYRIIVDKNASTPYAMGEAFKDEVPEIENVFRIYRVWSPKVKLNQNYFKENEFILADKEILSSLDIPILLGDPKNILNTKSSLLISDNIKQKYFPDENPIGQILEVSISGRIIDFSISGVFKHFPSYSSLQANFIGNIEDAFPVMANSFERGVLNKNENQLKYDWDEGGFTTVVLTNKNIRIDKTEQLCANIYKNHLNTDCEVTLQPFRQMYFHSNGIYNTFPFKTSQLSTLKIYAGIALLILLIACINYILISLADAKKQLKQVACHKINGASSIHIIKRYLQQSLTTSFLSLVPAMLFLTAIFPFFNHLFNKNLSVELFLKGPYLILLFTFIVFTGLVAGAYVSFYSSRLNPLQLLSPDTSKLKNKKSGKGSLVVVQFIIFILLCSFTFIMEKQLLFSTHKNPGFDMNNVLVFRLDNKEAQSQFPVIKSKIEQNPHVLTIAGTDDVPPTNNYGEISLDNGDFEPLKEEAMVIGDNLISTLKIPILEGDDYSEKDKPTGLIINEAAAKKYKVRAGEFIGIFYIKAVIADFHAHSLHRFIQPMLFIKAGNDRITKLVIRTDGENQQVINYVQNIWNEILPSSYLEYEILNDRINSFYEKERIQTTSVMFFALIAIVLAALGLFGYVALALIQRTKEIGIRKINGARISEVMAMLNKDFVKWVAIAFVIATPIAWYVMNKWLENFAYKTELSWWIFALAGLLALGIALLTVSWQSWKAATRNPVEALRYE